MERDLGPDIDRDAERAEYSRSGASRVSPEPRVLVHEPTLFRLRGSLYRLSTEDIDTLCDIGRFRTIALQDLARFRYADSGKALKDAMRSMQSQGVMHTRSVWRGPRVKPIEVAVLTKLGRELAERYGAMQDPARDGKEKQALYAGFVKPNEVAHDAAIYRMFQAERERIERGGGRVLRVILDYELKRKVYAPLAKAKALPAADYAKRQEQVARENGLIVIRGKIPLPDLRIEYATQNGESARIDLELATGHYHAPAMRAKAEAGFTFYAADDSRARLSRMLEERDITVAILSL